MGLPGPLPFSPPPPPKFCMTSPFGTCSGLAKTMTGDGLGAQYGGVLIHHRLEGDVRGVSSSLPIPPLPTREPVLRRADGSVLLRHLRCTFWPPLQLNSASVTEDDMKLIMLKKHHLLPQFLAITSDLLNERLGKVNYVCSCLSSWASAGSERCANASLSGNPPPPPWAVARGQ